MSEMSVNCIKKWKHYYLTIIYVALGSQPQLTHVYVMNEKIKIK